MKDFMSIGEMSQLFGLNKQTLHYYDRIGLFKPDRIGENGHRIYKFEQCYKLASICNMRYLGYSIKSIQKILENQNLETSIIAMKNQFEIINKEINKLSLLRDTIERKILFVENESKIKDYNEYTIKNFTERYYIPIGNEDNLYKDEAFYYNPTVVFYNRRERKEFGAYVYNKENVPIDMKNSIEIIPKGKYICGYHVGDHINILDTVKKIEKDNEDYKLENWSIHFNIIDQFIEKDNSKFVTEIQIGIKDLKSHP